MIVSVVLGSVLALATIAFVLAPVVWGVSRASRAQSNFHGRVPNAARELHQRALSLAIAALREIEFDRATGKLSDADYAALRDRYANEALSAMRVLAQQPTGAADDPAEAAVRAYRAAHPTCATCGIRPVVDSPYCSNCGRFLAGVCDWCGVAVTASGVRYCIDCGHRLTA